MKITKKETRVSVRITPYQETQLDLISEKLGIKRSTLVRYAIDNLSVVIMIYNWSKYRRKQNNLDKSEYNYMVNEAITKHYRYLHSRLVKVDDDEATFNDAYLMLTRKYNPEQDFIDQFIKAFNQLKGEYQRDDKCYNYAETKVEYYTDYIMPKEEKKEAPIQQIKPNNLIESIKKYAISEKKRKEQNKASKKKRKIGNLSK